MIHENVRIFVTFIASVSILSTSVSRTQSFTNEVDEYGRAEHYSSDGDAGSLSISLKSSDCYTLSLKKKMLSTLILTFRDVTSHVYAGYLVDWNNYEVFLQRMVQHCYEKAVELGYSYFGVAYYGECWASNISLWQDVPTSSNCVNGKYKPCSADSKTCAGKENSIFLYKIETRCPAGFVERLVCDQSPLLRCKDTVTKKNDCKLRYSCACPENKPYQEYGKCYKAFECPLTEKDGLSSKSIGHNFIIADSFTPSGFGYGMHVSAIRISAHWYHSIVLFKVDESCMRLSRRMMSKPHVQYLTMRYKEKQIKIVDLIQNKGKTGFTGHMAVAFPNPYKSFARCQVKVVKILDLRRYKSPGGQFPSNQTYLMFGRQGKAYMSHIPARCHDFQELVEIGDLPSSIGLKSLEKGIEIQLLDLDGKPDVDSKGTILSRLKLGNQYRFATSEGVHKSQSQTIEVKKIIAFDNKILNIFC